MHWAGVGLVLLVAWGRGGVGAGGSRARPAPFSRGESARRPQVQLHLVAMMKAKRHGPAHTVYKLSQRVLKTPIVAKSTYCLAVTAKGELTGEGERNAAGKPEGRGTMVYASGNMYEGQWLAGRQSGQGRCTFATGNVYEGSYKEDKKHGKGKETFPDGMVQVNCYDETLTLTPTPTLLPTLTLTPTLTPTLTRTRTRTPTLTLKP